MTMPLTNVIKNVVRRTVERTPDAEEPADLVQKRLPTQMYFDDDGVTPNHPKWPVLLYRNVIHLPKRFDNGTVFDALFTNNGWGRSWRASIYNFLHYHSQIHEVLGIARGHADIQFGGVKGKNIRIKAGDVVVLPAGTGHQRMKASPNFMVVGAYPPDGKYDECTDTRDRQKVKGAISKTKKPATDPVFGENGPLRSIWGRRPRSRKKSIAKE
jgi:uncharacterized protein YjlB